MSIFVRLAPLPLSVKGITVPAPDGTYNIYINQNLVFEMQKQVYIHELKHIKNNDFQSDKPVAQIESKISKWSNKEVDKHESSCLCPVLFR